MNLRLKIKDFHLSSVKKKQALLFYIIIALAVTIGYMPTFRGDFILDDNPLIKNNLYIRGAHSLSSYLAQEDGISDKRDMESGYHTGYYRPLINLTYWIDHKIWGLNAPGFRTTNLILHLLSCFVLYHLVFLFVNDQRAAFLATLLFSLHPVNTESVSLIVARNNILVTLFSLLSFYLYLKFWESGGYFKILISAFFFGLATLSKEFALMLLPIMFLYEKIIRGGRENIRKELYTYLPFVFVLISYFVLKQGVTESLFSPFSMTKMWARIYFVPYIIVYHLRCVFFPYMLHVFGVDYPASFLDWKALTSILLASVLGILLWKKRDYRLILFPALSFLVSLAPVLNIIPTSASSLVGMRWLYFPMSFLSIASAWLIKRALSGRRLVILCCTSAIILYFGVYTYILNEELWQNEQNFFRVEVLRFSNPLYYGGLAELYLNEKKYEDAEKYFRKSLKYYPDKADTYINYAALLIDTGRVDAALSYLAMAKSLTMTHNRRGQWFNNMGLVHFKLKNYGLALKNFLEAVEYCPDQPQFWGNLGAAYGSLGDYRNSISSLEKGLEIAPDSMGLRKNLALTYMKIQDYEKAIIILEKISLRERERNPDINILLRRARDGLLKRDYSFRLGEPC